MSCPVATGGSVLPLAVSYGAEAVPASRLGMSVRIALFVLISRCPVSGEGDVLGCNGQSEQGDGGWGWPDGVGVEGEPPAHSSQLRASPTHLDPAPSGSIRVAGGRTVGSGSGSLLIARRLWGNAPRRNSPRQSRPFCRLQSPFARTSLNLVSPLDLPAARPGCRPLPHLSAARLAVREVEVAQVGILSRLLCINVGLSVQAPSASHTICHSVWLPASPGCRHPGVPEHLGRRARLALMFTFAMLVLVVRQTRHVGRSVAQRPRACACLARPPRLPGPHHTRDEQ